MFSNSRDQIQENMWTAEGMIKKMSRFNYLEIKIEENGKDTGDKTPILNNYSPKCRNRKNLNP